MYRLESRRISTAVPGPCGTHTLSTPRLAGSPSSFIVSPLKPTWKIAKECEMSLKLLCNFFWNFVKMWENLCERNIVSEGIHDHVSHTRNANEKKLFQGKINNYSFHLHFAQRVSHIFHDVSKEFFATILIRFTLFQKLSNFHEAAADGHGQAVNPTLCLLPPPGGNIF